MVVHLLVCYLI